MHTLKRLLPSLRPLLFHHSIHCFWLIAIAFLSEPPVYSQTTIASPELLFPPNHAQFQFPGPQALIPFAWREVDQATLYQINVVVGNRPAAKTTTSATAIQLNLNLSARDSLATVHWSVRATTDSIFGPISPIFRFHFTQNQGTPIPGITPQPTPLPTSTPTFLPPPKKLIPQDGAIISALEGLQGIEFKWQPVTGAASYNLTVYRDNQPVVQKTLQNPQYNEAFTFPIVKIYQWDVSAVDDLGHTGSMGKRFSFQVGSDIYPTPTPMPLTVDINGNGKVDAEDIYHYALRFATNDPKVDFNHTGVNEKNDLIQFINLYRLSKN